MRTLGLIGGMSWESTQTYYQRLNTQVKQRLGGLNSAKLVLFSVNFAQIEELQRQGDWDAAAKILSRAALSLQAAGAEAIVICTNTMHKVAPEIEQVVSIPVLHIADATAKELQSHHIQQVALLGTAFTMEQDFYKQRLIEQGISVSIPTQSQRADVHRIIYDELCQGKILPESRHAFVDIIADLKAKGAQGVILGCTEIGLLINSDDTDVPLFDTTIIHAQSAVDWALS
ncbi:putative aspartate racemase [Vibrio halioticoli NBRC 102217]|uniref:Putative aspartate racemase n=1 Tax=Vibrio halioticoli NBRC 102217 TaxID=1219072 RepID=V5EZR2_9VIBR|nr:aspartate/glutamate racemase family protein [Vibrio halioticoli]GAD88319.1 putative aspartate racemase [Vibrio halioticoli NBRC 102217]